jgi:hypothetical protein
MNRRDTLKSLGLFAAGSFVDPTVLANFRQIATAIEQEKVAWTPVFVPAKHADLLAELVEAIVPATDTPGAKEALVHVFVDLYVKDVYPPERRKVFLEGLDAVESMAGKAFVGLPGAQRTELLVRLERESLERGEPAEQSFVRSLKAVTLLGYFSSKPGVTSSTSYVQSPGPFKGCIDLAPGTKADALS